MSWSVKSFPLSFVTLNDSDQKLQRIENMEPFKLTEGSNYMKTMKTVKSGQDASSFRVIEELGILYDLLPSLVQALEEDKKVLDVKTCDAVPLCMHLRLSSALLRLPSPREAATEGHSKSCVH